MAEVTIGSETYDAYITLAEANTYLEGQIAATAWRVETSDDNKGRAIVSATRFIDRQLWDGSKVDAYQVHAFPRTGLVYPGDDAVEVPSTTVPQEVLDATAELASLLLDGSEVQTNIDPNSGAIQSLKAGSVAISYFRTEALASRLPTILWELLGFWLAGGAASIRVESFGTDRVSSFEERDRFRLSEGL